MEIYKDLNNPDNQQFEKLLNSQLSKINIEEGKIIEGKVNKITDKYVFLHVDGLKSEPVLDINELKTMGLNEKIKIGEKIILQFRNVDFATITVDEIFTYDIKKMAMKFFGTIDDEHPGVEKIMKSANEFITGKISKIKKLSEKFVGGYLSIAAGFVLFVSILTSNFYLIVIGMLLFGFGTANFIAIIFRLAIRVTDEPINLTVANLITLGFSGFIFGPALVGYLAEYLSLTFNMYLLSVVWGLNGVALIVMMDRIKSSL